MRREFISSKDLTPPSQIQLVSWLPYFELAAVVVDNGAGSIQKVQFQVLYALGFAHGADRS
jgi:hypothetical protein